MTRFRLARVCALGILICAGGGCVPGGDAPGDELREPHFLTGQKLARQLDYQGAIDAYEKALQVNPRSAAAHFELALLEEDKDKGADPAAAIYHFQRFLKLSPGTDNKIDVAQQHILNCKMELARTVASLTPMAPVAQSNVEKIMLENRDLRAQVTAWQEYYRTTRGPTPTNALPPAAATNPVAVRGASAPASPESVRAALPQTNTVVASRPAAVAGTYTVKAGDTLAAIARSHGISLDALQSANPGVDSRRLRVGAILNLPSR